ncbi:hypothetical protein BDV28DRAFT_130052 [Aspergillus coremiiformis]|uniref:Uncharacterized protein n=1 Tax=Aspergillus coremiiformis TaxID=138285 RepID=A0A5N6ZDV6_9EURO|nr:hypothetical protein BDV28DRAFT_130052 [Aspergillus coremiiformis]
MANTVSGYPPSQHPLTYKTRVSVTVRRMYVPALSKGQISSAYSVLFRGPLIFLCVLY